MRRILKVLLIIILVPALILGIIILYAAITKYRPVEREVIYSNDSSDVISDTASLNFMIWNIGYCGLNREMDFFYDGGKRVRPEKKQVIKNVNGVRDILKQNDSLDFIMIQEIDVKSHRSYNIREIDSFAKALPAFHNYFSKNYDVFFVPVPFTEPMGTVNSGIESYAKSRPFLVERYSYPSHFSFPKNLFMLDRCFMVEHFKLSTGKELLIINTHNSAYDPGGVLRKAEMDYFKKYLMSQYEKGNFVIVGGDWNQSPAGFVPAFTGHPFDTIDITYIPDHYLPENWTWLYDNTMPSNRRVDAPYDESKTMTTVIDFYLLSPNVQAISVKTRDLGFAYSDHHPVIARMRLNGKQK
jgi:endonuclease/exonuclease/phosphatase family metal-dependent hydrolase